MVMYSKIPENSKNFKNYGNWDALVTKGTPHGGEPCGVWGGRFSRT
ncbi:hypothetical protein HMPREF3227_00141 [Corynebacterium sp. CMW7794]|nr:hypothetical protein HMPREF3227_00141 [Corynebacterium sp. CMW7794]